MKKIVALLLPCLLLPLLATAQPESPEKTRTLPKNTIMVTPLMGLIDDSKPAIYYKRLLHADSENYYNLRVGTGLFSSIANKYSAGLEYKTSSHNLMLGLEIGKRIDKVSIYFGPELSQTWARMDGATLFPDQNAIFSDNSITAMEWVVVDRTNMSLFSLIGFFGVRYHITGALSVGLESALGVGWYKSTQHYQESNFSGVDKDTHKGFLKDFAANRFVTVAYSF